MDLSELFSVYALLVTDEEVKPVFSCNTGREPLVKVHLDGRPHAYKQKHSCIVFTGYRIQLKIEKSATFGTVASSLNLVI